MSKDEQVINGITFFSTKIAASKLGITPAQVGKQCREGKLVAQKVGNAWFVQIDEPTVVDAAKEVPKKIAGALVRTLPTKPMAQLPVAYVKSLPMIIGVLTMFALFFLGTMPLASKPVAAHVSLGKPFTETTRIVASGYVHVMQKTDELLTTTSQTASLGVFALGDQLSQVAHPVEHGEGRVDRTRPSALARTVAQGNRIPVLLPVLQGVQQMAAAAASLYQFEFFAHTTAPFSGGSTWGCILGLDDCIAAQHPTEPLRGVTVYDVETKEIFCLQVRNRAPVSTPGRCRIEDRE